MLFLCCSLTAVLRVPQATGLHFRHTDNVIQWLNAMSEKGLPKVNTHTHAHTVLLPGEDESGGQCFPQQHQAIQCWCDFLLSVSLIGPCCESFLGSTRHLIGQNWGCPLVVPWPSMDFFFLIQKQKFLHFLYLGPSRGYNGLLRQELT